MILEGIRVLDFSQYLAGAGVTRLMAELGAEIIKVEQAPGGDPGRLIPFIREGRSGFFVQQNRGKQSLCLDMRKDEARQICLDLAKECDVVLENFGPGVMDKRGFTWERFSAINPRLIMCSVSAFGRDSPLSHKTGFDWIVQAFAGLMHMTGPRDGPPHPIGLSLCDGTSAVTAFGGIMAALYRRERTGKGQYLDLSMVDIMYQMHEANVQGPSLTDGAFVPNRMGSHHELVCPMGVFKGPTGYIVIMVLDMQWPNMCEALGRPDLVAHPDYATGQLRAARRDSIVQMVEAWMATFPNDEAVLAALEAARVPSGPVLSPTEALHHPYYRERGTIREVNDPLLGKLKVPGFPYRFSAQPELPDLTAPLLGEHNAEILDRVLGLDPARIEALTTAGVLVAGKT